MDDYEDTRQRQLAYLAGILPDQVDRLKWPAEKLQLERRERLRDLLRVALARSPWHRERLGGIEPDSFREEDLPRLPPMTKADLMTHWDAIVTDHRLTLERADRHLENLTSDAYLFGEFHAAASGGSCGRRGVFVYGWKEWAVAYVGLHRTTLWDRAVSPELARLPNSIAVVAAQNAAHMTSSMPQTFASPQMTIARFPLTLPVSEIVAGLNAFQPVMLLGYPSALALLAVEAGAGRLRIAPKRLMSTSEPLLPHVRSAVEQAFAAPVANVWGLSEAGPMGVGCWRGAGLHLCDDLVIVEPVDRSGRPVPVGTRSDKIYLTAIANPTLPLIRYEITDQMMFLADPCPCGSAHQLVADVEGRLDDVFTYAGGPIIHPHLFRSLLLKETGIVEYQVRQTPAGAEIRVIGAVRDPAAIARAIEAGLSRRGLAGATVLVRTVDQLERLATGKVRRFVNLA